MKRSKKLILLTVTVFILLLFYFGYNAYQKNKKEPSKKTETVAKTTYNTYNNLINGSTHIITDKYIIINNKYILNQDGSLIDTLNGNDVTLIENYGAHTISRFYYYKDNGTIHIKGNGLKILDITSDTKIKYESFVKALSIDDNNLILFYTEENETYFILYNSEDEEYSEPVKYISFIELKQGNENHVAMVKRNTTYSLYSFETKTFLNTSYKSYGLMDNVEDKNYSTNPSLKYILVTNSKNKSGFILNDGTIEIKPEYDKISSFSENYFVVSGSKFSLYGYNNEIKLSNYDYIYTNNNYVLAYKLGNIEIYDSNLNLLSKTLLDIDIVAFDPFVTENTMEIRILSSEKFINLKCYEKETGKLLKSFLYTSASSQEVTYAIEAIYNEYNEKIGYYKIEYNESTKAASINLYDKDFSGYDLIEMTFNSMPKIHYVNGFSTLIESIDGYVIYNRNLTTKILKVYSLEEGIKKIKEDITFEKENVMLRDSSSKEIPYTIINTVTKLNNGKYLFNIDNKYQVFTK